MYCPKCGTPLDTRQNAQGVRYLYCEPGQMAVSHKLQELLERRYGEDAPAHLVQSPRPARSPTYPHEWGWYCPGCGVPLNGWLECPRCGKHLRDLAYQLVELHPHRPDPNAPQRLTAHVLGLGQVQERADHVELRVELYGEPLQAGPAHLRTRSGGLRPVRVISCGLDASQSMRNPRRALVIVEGMTRRAFQAGEYLEQDIPGGAREQGS